MKFAAAAVALIAFAGLVCADPLHSDKEVASRKEFDDNEQFSEWALISETVEDETRYLSEQNQIFKEFCIQSRDHVKLFMDKSVKGIASRVFNIMFNTVGDIGQEALAASGKALKDGVEQIRKRGGSEVVEIEPKNKNPTSQAEIEENLEDGKQQIQRGYIGGLWSFVVGLGKAAVQTIFNAIASETAVRIALLKSEFAVENIPTHINTACGELSFKLKSELEENLRKYVRQVKPEDTEGKFTEALRIARIENVGCATTSSIYKAAALCDCIRIAGPTLYPLLGL